MNFNVDKWYTLRLHSAAGTNVINNKFLHWKLTIHLPDATAHKNFNVLEQHPDLSQTAMT